MYKRLIKVALTMLMLLFFCTACTTDGGEKKQLEYTICDKTKLPDELNEIIEEKKDKAFSLSYQDSNYLYIVVCYGEMNRKSLCVKLENVYYTDYAIYVDTSLYTEGELTGEGGVPSMHPYIVIKTERKELPVIYQM